MRGYRNVLVFVISLLVCASPAPSPSSAEAAAAPLPFAAHFTRKTMRVDYFHTGGLGREIVAHDRVVSDGAWAGSLDALRERGVPTMFGAAPYLEREFRLSRRVARDVLLYWMRTFAERHPEEA